MIGLVDTSVLCNILDIPGKNQDHDRALEELRRYIEDGTKLLLPFATIIETGNHIGKLSDGQTRRRYGELFRRTLIESIDGTAPWTPTQLFDVDALRKWIDEFPDYVMSGRFPSLSDASIWPTLVTENVSSRRSHG